MEEYLTPSIGEAIALVHTSCNDLTKQALIRDITEITSNLIKGDPELADIILEGKKSIEACLRYVNNEAAYVIEKQVMAMSDAERELVPKSRIQGKIAFLGGGVVGKDSVEEWVDDYYYKAEGLDPVGTKIEEQRKKEAEEAKERKAKAKSGKNTKKSNGEKGNAIPEKEVPPEVISQTSLFSA